MAKLIVDQISISVAGRSILSELSFEAHSGEVLGLLGPSGCGKTSLLRAIAGFVPVDTGRIVLDEKVLSAPSSMRPAAEREVGIVFQDWALFPHLSVCDNICFGISHYPAAEQRHICQSMLDMVGMLEFHERYPHELSGGQQQRVALIRALASSPKVLLLDEAFSNLEPELRQRLCSEVRALLKARDTIGILVSHYPEDLAQMSDRVIDMSPELVAV